MQYVFSVGQLVRFIPSLRKKDEEKYKKVRRVVRVTDVPGEDVADVNHKQALELSDLDGLYSGAMLEPCRLKVVEAA